jgi:hypothetical protein
VRQKARNEFTIFLPDADAEEGRQVAVAAADRVATTAVREPGGDEGFRLTRARGWPLVPATPLRRAP